MKENKKITTTMIAVLVILGILTFTVHQYHKATELDGTYTGKVTFLIFTSEDKLTFSKDKTFKENGTPNKGTYHISGNKLTLNFENKNKTTITAKLSEKHDSFTITSTKGDTDLANGIKYTKKKQ